MPFLDFLYTLCFTEDTLSQQKQLKEGNHTATQRRESTKKVREDKYSTLQEERGRKEAGQGEERREKKGGGREEITPTCMHVKRSTSS